MMTPSAFTFDWLTDAVAGLSLDGVRVLGHGLWGPTLDLGDGTLLKLVRRRAGIGDGLDIHGNEARVLLALGGRPLGHLATPRVVAHGIFVPGTRAAAQGFAAWLRLTRVAGLPFDEERLARLSGSERDRFARSFGAAIATIHLESAAALGTNRAFLDDRVRALLSALATASPADSALSVALTARLDEIPAPQRSGFVHGDAHLSNLLVDGDGLVSGIVDFAEAGRGFPEIDLVYLHWLPQIARQARGSYEAAAGPIDESAYNLAGAIYALTGAVIQEQNGESSAAAAERRLLADCLKAIGLAL